MSELTSQESKFEVTYELSYTMNMGNYESLRVHVGLKQDGTGSTKADVDKVMARTRKWVEDNLGTAVSEVRAEISSGD